MKLLKKISLVVIALSLTVFSVFSAFAETIYVVDGYSYSITNNENITLQNWDTSKNETLTLPDMLVNRYFNNIANWAFEGRTDLKGLDLSGAHHLQRIGYESFIGCSGIVTDLVIPESVINLNDRSFCNCSSIPSITIYGHVSYIPTECFYGCSSVKTVVLPETLQAIQSWAFGECTALEYVKIPKSVTNIAISSFKNDPNLTLGVWYGSYGYEYAIAQNIPYVLLDGALLGDANGDGLVNINDVTAIQRFKADMETLEGIALHAADVNGDGNVTIEDATILQRYFAEYDDVDYQIDQVITQ